MRTLYARGVMGVRGLEPDVEPKVPPHIRPVLGRVVHPDAERVVLGHGNCDASGPGKQLLQVCSRLGEARASTGTPFRTRMSAGVSGAGIWLKS